MKVDLQEIDELLHNSNLSEVAKAVGIPYRTLQAWKRGENKWWADTQDKLTKLQNYANMEENTMENKIKGLIAQGLEVVSKSAEEDMNAFGDWPQIFKELDIEVDESFEVDGREFVEGDEVYVSVPKSELRVERLTEVQANPRIGNYDLYFQFSEFGVWFQCPDPESELDTTMSDTWFDDNFEWVAEQIRAAGNQDFNTIF